MSKRKGGGGKGQEETKLQILDRIANKKFFNYGIPVHKQFRQRIDAYVEEDNDFDQVLLFLTISFTYGKKLDRME